jgi:hypothetical protein
MMVSQNTSMMERGIGRCASSIRHEPQQPEPSPIRSAALQELLGPVRGSSLTAS